MKPEGAHMKERCTGAQGALEVLAFPLRLLAAIFVCTLLLSGASAQGNSALHESPRAAQVRALNNSILQLHGQVQENAARSEERREGKECRSRWSPYH